MPNVIAAAVVSAIGATGTAAAVATALVNVAFYAAADSLASILAPRTQAAEGRPTEWTPDPDAPGQFVYGRRGVAGTIVHRDTYGPDNRYQWIVSVYSGGGPINAYGDFLLDGTPKTFTGETMNGSPINALYRQTKLGAQPDTALTGPSVSGGYTPTGWTSAHKLSGKACSGITLFQDGNFKRWPTGEPKPIQELQGILCYDPRLDSTYPGGSGSCDLGDRTTWVYTRNGAIHGLNWSLGVFENGVQVGGIGASVAHIDVDSFIATANVADANSWYCDAVCYSDAPAGDDKYEVLTAMLQTCGARPGTKQGKISCVSYAANGSSVVTITGEDVLGPFEYDGMMSRQGRINTVIPRRVSEAHDWENVDDAPVSSSTYVTEDGGATRSRGIAYPYVTGTNQAAQLARYDIANSREGIAGTITLKPALRDLDPGECFTINEAEFGMSSLKCLVLARSYDPMADVVTVTFRSETAAKHAWALAGTGTAPATPSLGYTDPNTVPTPSGSDWSVAAGTADTPSLVLTGAVPSTVNISKVIVEYKAAADSVWIPWVEMGSESLGLDITGLQSAVSYDVGLTYRNIYGVPGSRLTLSGTTTGSATVPGLGDLATLDTVIIGATGNVLAEDGVTNLTNATVITSLGTAANITGQGTLATLNTVGTSQIDSAAVTAAKIASAAVTTAKFASGIEPVTIVSSVPGTKSTETIFNTTDKKTYRWNGTAYIATLATTDLTGTVTDAQIAGMAASKVTGTLTNSQIADLAATKITGTLTNSQIADLAAAKLTGQITTTQITDNSVTTAKVNAGAITTAKIAADAVTATEIAAGAVTATEIAAGAITTAKIAAGAVTAGEIAALAITTPKLAAGAVTTAKIAAGSITASEIAAGAITAGKIAAGTIVAADIATDTITSGQIAAGAVSTSELAANAVTAAKIAAGTITATEIAASTITAAKLNITDLSAISANLGTITVGTANITNLSVTTGKIVDGNVSNIFQARTTNTLLLTSSYAAYSDCALTYTPTGGGTGQRIAVYWGYRTRGGTNQTNVVSAYLKAYGQVTGDPPGDTEVTSFVGDSNLSQYPPPSAFESTYSWVNSGDTTTIGAAMDSITFEITVKFGSGTNPPTLTGGYIVIVETLR